MEIEPDPVTRRLCGDYLLLLDRTQAFVACDAIALGMLAHETQGWLQDYYRAAFHAVVHGLRLHEGAHVLGLLAREWHPTSDDVTLQRSFTELCGFHHLTRLRRRALALYHLNRGHAFGDPFLGTDRDLQGRPYQPGFRQVSAWWTASRGEMAHGVRLVDEALCAMLAWDAAAALPLDALIGGSGYPDPAPVYERWADSF